MPSLTNQVAVAGFQRRVQVVLMRNKMDGVQRIYLFSSMKCKREHVLNAICGHHGLKVKKPSKGIALILITDRLTGMQGLRESFHS